MILSRLYRSCKKDFIFFLSTGVVAILVVLSIVGPLLAPYPNDAYGEVHLEKKLLPPGLTHVFGTDFLGRDILSQILCGTRTDLVAAIITVGLTVIIGVPLGLAAGYARGFTSETIMRLADLFVSFPPLTLPLFLAALFGSSMFSLATALAISWWPWYARIVRSQVISVRENVYVEAAEAGGMSKIWILRKHILPNSISPIIVQVSMDFGYVILAISAFSFLGFGVKPPIPEWGLLLSSTRAYFLDYWWTMFFPGFWIFLAVLVFNLVGDGLRDLLDPRV